MALQSDLKHVLENIYYSTTEIIELSNPIKFTSIETGLTSEIQKVYLKGRSWKMSDEWNNEWTISTLGYMWQANLYQNLLSMRDRRVKPQNYDLSL